MSEYKSGFIAIIGRPNVGKSTLVNSLVGQKIAIMSDKPQTTRNKILCVLTQPGAQMVFLDTPGVHKPLKKLGQYMSRVVENTLKEIDAIVFVVDVTEKMGAGERYIIERLKAANRPVVLAVNKIDLVPKERLLPLLDQYSRSYDYAAIVPLSAKDKTNLPGLVAELRTLLPEGPQYYPDDMVTDQPERLLAAELIREKVLTLTRDEVPHSVAVDLDELTRRPNDTVFIRATIYVERDSQKGILIGKSGAMLKEVGALARKEIETLLGSKIYLDLWVKVRKDWRNRDAALKALGFD